MTKDFTQMRTDYKARISRLYEWCDNEGFMNDVINAAADAGIGVFALTWFGYTGGNEWITRTNDSINAILTNPKAPYVIRAYAFGSEPFTDDVLPETQLAQQMLAVKKQLSSLNMTVYTSDSVGEYQQSNDAPDVFKATDLVGYSILPWWAENDPAPTNAWSDVVEVAITYAQKHGQGKPILMCECGYPSGPGQTWPPPGPQIASVANAQMFLSALNSHCPTMKSAGVGYTWQSWDDASVPGWGVVSNGKAKYDFQPVTSC